MSAFADTDHEVRCATRTARGFSCRRAKDDPAEPKTQARATNRFHTFAPVRDEGMRDRPAPTPATCGDTRRQVGPSKNDDVRWPKPPLSSRTEAERRSGTGVHQNQSLQGHRSRVRLRRPDMTKRVSSSVSFSRDQSTGRAAPMVPSDAVVRHFRSGITMWGDARQPGCPMRTDQRRGHLRTKSR